MYGAVILLWWAWTPLLSVIAAAHVAHGGAITARRLARLSLRLLLPASVLLAAAGSGAHTSSVGVPAGALRWVRNSGPRVRRAMRRRGSWAVPDCQCTHSPRPSR